LALSAMNEKIRRVTVCAQCGQERALSRPNRKWCGQSCRQKAYREGLKLRLQKAEKRAKDLNATLALWRHDR
jgi:hypothetical protein